MLDLQPLYSRIQFTKRVLAERRWVALVVWGVPYAIAAFYSFLRSEGFSDYPPLRQIITPQVLNTWLVLGAILFIVVFIEGCYRLTLKEINNTQTSIRKQEVQPLQKRVDELEKILDEPRARRINKIRKPKLANLSSSLDGISKKILELAQDKDNTISMGKNDWDSLDKLLKSKSESYELISILEKWEPYRRMWELNRVIRLFCDGKNKGIKQIIINSGLQTDIDKLDSQIASIGDSDLTDLYHKYFEILYNISTLDIQPEDVPGFGADSLVTYTGYRDELKKALQDQLTDINKQIEVLDLGS